MAAGNFEKTVVTLECVHQRQALVSKMNQTVCHGLSARSYEKNTGQSRLRAEILSALLASGAPAFRGSFGGFLVATRKYLSVTSPAL